MDKTQAIITLLTGPAWGRLSKEEVAVRVTAIKALGVTQGELAAARRELIRQEAASLRADAEAREKAAANVTDWTDPA